MHWYEAECEHCKSVTRSGEPTLEGTALGKNLATVACALRATTGASYEQMRAFIYGISGVEIAETTLYRAMRGICEELQPVVTDIGREVLGSPWIHVDETSYVLITKEGRETIWTWIFCTPTTALYHLEDSRGKKVIETVFELYKHPSKPPPIGVTDAYGAYTNTFKLKQLGWAHLLREAKALAKCCESGKEFYRLLGQLFAKCKRIQQALRKQGLVSVSTPLYQRVVRDMQRIASLPTGCDDVKTLQKRLRTKGEQYLTGLSHSAIPLTNNHAERYLRPVVLQRKHGKPLRSRKALQHYGALLSVFTTLKLRSISVTAALRAYLKLILSPTFTPSDVC